MSTFQKHLLNEIAAGHDGPPIPESKRVYFEERFRWRLFDFITSKFEAARQHGLTQAKLARRIEKPPEVVNRWLSAPSNLTADSVCDLLLGISAEEMEMFGRSVLNQAIVNYDHLAEEPIIKLKSDTTAGTHTLRMPAGV